MVKASFIPFFQDMAKLVASKSKDPSSKCGTVIVDPKNLAVIGLGFNGIPRGVEDDLTLYPSRHDRTKQKYLFYEHGERNAIYSCARCGIKTEGCVMFITGMPCADCARAIIQAGIMAIYIDNKAGASLLTDDRWKANFEASEEMLREAGVEIITLA